MEKEVAAEDSLSGNFPCPAFFMLRPDLAISILPWCSWVDLAATVDDVTWSVKLSRVEN